MPDALGKSLERRGQALVTVHGVAVIAQNQVIVLGSTLSVVDATAIFPGSSARIGPSEVTLSVLQDPSVVKALKLFGHVIRHMPNGRSVTVVDLAVVPDL